MKKQLSTKKLFKAGILVILLIAVDQATKLLADIVLAEKTISVIGQFFQLDLAHNPGFAFSMGASWPQWLTTSAKMLIPLAAAVFAFFRIKASDCTRLEALSLSLLTAGAFGNLIDRLFRGYVIDFLLFKMYGLLGFQYWPTFNIADLLIVSGTIGFAITQLFAAANERQMEKRKLAGGIPQGTREAEGVPEMAEERVYEEMENGAGTRPQ